MLLKLLLLVGFISVSFQGISQGKDVVRFAPLPLKPREELVASYLPLVNLLERKLGVKFEILYVKNYEELFSKIAKGEVDIMTTGPLGYYTHLIKKGHNHVHPVVFIKESDGETFYKCVLVTMESGPKTVRELKGPIALPQKLSTCGYFSLSIILSKHKRNVKDFKYTFFDTHNQAFESVLSGEYQAAVGKESVAKKYKKGFPMRVIEESPDWPAFVLLANSRTLKGNFIERLKSTLTSLSLEELKTISEGRYGFAPARKEDFEVIKNYESHLPK
ncbi:MAG: PhnD/SsuA/transferrin family substrate-binding protein [Aquificaceae bacterium]|nr:PhnD/SsuA/transferrin family substrate-binding protein [Aquificaceae bacterium]